MFRPFRIAWSSRRVFVNDSRCWNKWKRLHSRFHTLNLYAGRSEGCFFHKSFHHHFGERMSINALPIADDKLIYYVEMIQPLVAELDKDAELTGITEFEIITAMAFKIFL